MVMPGAGSCLTLHGSAKEYVKKWEKVKPARITVQILSTCDPLNIACNVKEKDELDLKIINPTNE